MGRKISFFGTAAVLLSFPLYANSATLVPRDDCRTIKVQANDGCAALAARCGISRPDFTKYNSDPSLCSSLSVGQQVCCSAGDLPVPKQNTDGSCRAYIVVKDDSCSSIANGNGVKLSDLSKFNDKTTWGWTGCDNLQLGLAICLSDGYPPMPQPQPGAVCGPVVNGSTRAGPDDDLSAMNSCPLKACCDIWGQCGINPEFCTEEISKTGNPGTAPPGHNGCISNCGWNITNKQTPSDFKKIGYYESWNFDRPCLNMKVDSVYNIDGGGNYTHMHWAFGLIDQNDFSISIEANHTTQWKAFLALTDMKRILSLGGWGFSTDPSTYAVLRTATQPQNRDKFVDQVVKFVNDNSLDGIDFDWEYAGEPDIPGIPAGDKSEGAHYLEFLSTLRDKLDSSKSMSIAAPASYWYLKQFPITVMAEWLDYIVFMTYDLHGQWDYANKFADEGCPGGSCLRSHVNLTETQYALAMITKAGVTTDKIIVGMSTYGRSFKMTDLSCTGPDCTFTGPLSGATPGRCTGTAGYISNAEINELIAFGARSYYDEGSSSDIVVSGNDWIAYMGQFSRSTRQSVYQYNQLGGVVDWSIHLLQFTGDDGSNEDGDNSDDDDDNDDDDYPGGTDLCTNTYNSLADLDKDADSIDVSCVALYSLQALAGDLGASVKQFNDLMASGYDSKFQTYAKVMSDQAGSSVHDFMYDHGNDYFTCFIEEIIVNCDTCHDRPVEPHRDPCRYCPKPASKREMGVTSTNSSEQEPDLITHHLLSREGVGGGPFNHPAPVHWKNLSEPCPPDYSQRGDSGDDASIWWTLSSDKADSMYADLLASTGVPKDKTTFGNKDRGSLCAPSAKPDDTCYNTDWDFNILMANGYGPGDVANPKDTVLKALDNSNDMRVQLEAAIIDVEYGSYTGDAQDLVDAVSLPALMVVEAVAQMQSISDEADEIDKEKREAIIIGVFSALLFFIPIAGEAIGAVAEVGSLAAITATIGAAGDVGLGIYDIVKDPQNPLSGILQIITAPLALGDIVKVGKAAELRRTINEGKVSKLGPKISDGLGTLSKVTSSCKRV